jgi:hypothetical protein
MTLGPKIREADMEGLQRIKVISYIVFLFSAMAGGGLGLVQLWFEHVTEFTSKLLATFVIIALVSVLIFATTREMINHRNRSG